MIILLPVALIRALLGKDPWRGQWIKDWLTEPLTLDDVEAGFERSGDCETWNRMKAKIEPADELWAYKSPPDTWHRLCGREGICLKRDDEIIESIVTVKN